jgi:hypothetical protein
MTTGKLVKFCELDISEQRSDIRKLEDASKAFQSIFARYAKGVPRTTVSAGNYKFDPLSNIL